MYGEKIVKLLQNSSIPDKFPKISRKENIHLKIQTINSSNKFKFASYQKMKPLNINIPQAEGKKFTKNYQKLLKITKKLQMISKYFI